MDALCIVQDDDNWKCHLANTHLTIISADGVNADYGLRVLRGISQAKNTRSKVHRLTSRLQVVREPLLGGWLSKSLGVQGVKLTPEAWIQAGAMLKCRSIHE